MRSLWPFLALVSAGFGIRAASAQSGATVRGLPFGGSDGQCLLLAGGLPTWGACAPGVGAAAGNDTQIQFNDGGALAGVPSMVFNKTSGVVSVNIFRAPAVAGIIFQDSTGVEVVRIGNSADMHVTANSEFDGTVVMGNTITASSLITGVVKSASGVLSGGATSTDLPEGTNLYYTDVRVAANAAVAANTAARHSHANKANLDTINQNMASTDAVSFAGVTTTGALNTTVRTVAALPATVADTDVVVLVSVAGTLALPTCTTRNGRRLEIKRTGVGDVVVDPNGAETIDGATTKTIATQWDSMSLVCNGTAWFVI